MPPAAKPEAAALVYPAVVPDAHPRPPEPKIPPSPKMDGA
jgi:hypothetical protein